MPQEQHRIVAEISDGVLRSIWWNGPGEPKVEVIDWDENNEAAEKKNVELSAEIAAGEGWKEVW